MIQKLLKARLFFLLIILVSGCQQPINLDHLRPEPRLVLNSLPASGKPVEAVLSQTWFYTDDRPDLSDLQADVILYINDELIGKMKPDDVDASNPVSRTFRSDAVADKGDRIKIVASATGFKEIQAMTVIPEMPEIIGPRIVKKTEYIREYGREQKINRHYYEFTLSDPPGSKDYYMLFIETYTAGFDNESEGYWYPSPVYFNEEPIFSNQLTTLDKIMGYDWIEGHGRAFSDELFDGKDYTFSLRSTTYDIIITDGEYDPYGRNTANYAADENEDQVPTRLTLYKLSEHYYRYLQSLQLQKDNITGELINIGMADPIRIYSNVTNGTGIVGGCHFIEKMFED